MGSRCVVHPLAIWGFKFPLQIEMVGGGCLCVCSLLQSKVLQWFLLISGKIALYTENDTGYHRDDISHFLSKQ